MLELKGIHKYYNPGTVYEMCLFDDFGLQIGKGEFVSVVGSNGSGKTSMLNLICGSISPEKGSILMDGKDITKEKEVARLEMWRVLYDMDDQARRIKEMNERLEQYGRV